MLNRSILLPVFAFILLTGCPQRPILTDGFEIIGNPSVTIDTFYSDHQHDHPDTVFYNADTSRWTSYFTLHAAWQLGYEKRMDFTDANSDQVCFLRFWVGNDTFMLENMMGEDRDLLKHFALPRFSVDQIFLIKHQKSGEKHLFISWDNDGFGIRGDFRLNIIFPLKSNGRPGAPFAYYTNTFHHMEGEACLDCVTDMNNDGHIDYIQWVKPWDDDRIYLNNFEEGSRKRWFSGYRVRYVDGRYFIEVK